MEPSRGRAPDPLISNTGRALLEARPNEWFRAGAVFRIIPVCASRQRRSKFGVFASSSAHFREPSSPALSKLSHRAQITLLLQDREGASIEVVYIFGCNCPHNRNPCAKCPGPVRKTPSGNPKPVPGLANACRRIQSSACTRFHSSEPERRKKRASCKVPGNASCRLQKDNVSRIAVARRTVWHKVCDKA